MQILKNREKQKRHLAECRSEGSEFCGYATSITGSGDLGREHVWRLGWDTGDWAAGGDAGMHVLFRVEQGQQGVWELDRLLVQRRAGS